MELREYAERVKEEIMKKMPDLDISISENYKANDHMLTGINIKEKDSNIAPCIYVDQFYHDGDTVMECSDKIIEIYNDNSQKNLKFDVDQMLEYDKAKNNLFIRVVNKNNNKEFLSDVPHLDFGDLSIYFNVMILKSKDQIGSSKVNNNVINSWNISLIDLYKQAIKNTKKMYPMRIDPISNVINKMLSEKGIKEDLPLENEPLYVVTTESTMNGSFYITDKESLKEIGNKVNDNFYILPSSIHELLIVPEHSDTSFGTNINNEEELVDNLFHMVHEVNRTCVEDNEILSDNVYKYDRENERLYDHDGNQIIFY